MAALLFLGFSSGLPLLLISKTLQAWMTIENVNVAVISLFSIVAIPYSLKFLWAPLLDRYSLPFLGRRRGWLLVSQVGLLVAIAAMFLQNPSHLNQLSLSKQELCANYTWMVKGLCELWQKFQQVSASPLFWTALVIAFMSATQDIAIDAYRTDILEPLEMGAGVAIYILGYRISLLLTGSLALILADRIPWPIVYLVMAACMLIGLITTLLAPEPVVDSDPLQGNRPPESLADAVILPFQEFFQRSGIIQSLLMLVFIILYKLGDALVNNLSTPFLLKTGFTQTDIGAIQGGMGLLATIVGTLLGGAILSRLGINRSLWIFGGLQAISNLAYFVLAQIGKDYTFMVIAINLENFCGGLGTAAFVAFLMSLCNRRFSATQYALLSSLMAVSRDILVAPAGKIAEATGWPTFFLITLVAASPGLLLLPAFAPWNQAIVVPASEPEDSPP